jgi:hypothetical protein
VDTHRRSVGSAELCDRRRRTTRTAHPSARARTHAHCVSLRGQTVDAQLHAQSEAQRRSELEERTKLESANAELRKVKHRA